MTYPQPDEFTLIERARAGDEAACRLLVIRHESAVAATVIGMIGPGDEADDVGQETFIRFFRSLDRFRGDASVKTYLQRIAMNLSLNALKRRKRVERRVLRLDDAVRAHEPSISTSGEHEARDLADRVRAAVDTLSPKHRAVVVLRMIDERSTREAAAILGVPEGTVLSRLARAMTELRERLR